MKTFQILNIILVAMLAMVSSCSNPDGDYKKAEQANTDQAYNEFIKKHPDTLSTLTWMEEYLKIEIQDNSELLTVSLTGDNPVAAYIRADLPAQFRRLTDRMSPDEIAQARLQAAGSR